MKAHEFWAWVALVSMGLCIYTGYRHGKKPRRRVRLPEKALED